MDIYIPDVTTHDKNNVGDKAMVALAIAGTIVMVLAALGVIYYVTTVKPRAAFNASFREITCVREMSQQDKPPVCTDDFSKQPVDSQGLFSPQMLMKYQKGDGFELKAIKTLNGHEQSMENYTVSAFSEFREKYNNERRKELITSKEGFDDPKAGFWKRYVSNELIPTALPIIVDDTSGVDQKMAENGRRIANAALENLLKTNAPVTVACYRMGVSNATDKQVVEFPEGFTKFPDGQKEPMMQAFQKCLDYVFEIRHDKPSSSIVGGLFVDLSDDVIANKKYRQVLWFSDGIENSKTVDLYKERGLLQESKWDELDQRLLHPKSDDGAVRELKFPDLSNTSVEMYAPPVDEDITRESENYWMSRLARAGAKPVRIHFGY